MLKPKFQYFGHLMWTADLIGEVPDAGKDSGQKEKRASEDEMSEWITDAMGMNLGKLWEVVRDREPWLAAVRGVAKSRTWLGDWATTTKADEMSASPWRRVKSESVSLSVMSDSLHPHGL